MLFEPLDGQLPEPLLLEPSAPWLTAWTHPYLWRAAASSVRCLAGSHAGMDDSQADDEQIDSQKPQVGRRAAASLLCLHPKYGLPPAVGVEAVG